MSNPSTSKCLWTNPIDRHCLAWTVNHIRAHLTTYMLTTHVHLFLYSLFFNASYEWVKWGKDFVSPLKLTLHFSIAIDKINSWKTTNEHHVSHMREHILSLFQVRPIGHLGVSNGCNSLCSVKVSFSFPKAQYFFFLFLYLYENQVYVTNHL